ncbi:uncharacterized protein NFIA_094480 [Aspergillus fischeri NRRL 181]|uniref:Uncharacterized protein n=1 Tax=Neosartorya fischeri (strain ATCC 1020 / DSM 3700 / CBS 544.65 / FGSC A1164 / JCM 1740 / NRRL 181 / WB 181) TaxID=331117 RepID=A1DAD8_NEOFI|nr:uncharacterized protein NFIA_094480 [Aspergillus fischeri NRRL 181]EAW19828.1 hypothetical protein NFIA_094480 [Aspergillus fischeri NRRL 181]KAG2003936.1 hypothetical protein GB937_009300 [Aspergillus fischeri]
MIFKTVIEQTVTKQGFAVSMDNSDGGVTLSIDTKKQVHRDAEYRVEKLGDGSTNEYKVSAIDKTPGNLRVTLNEDSSHQAQCLGSWKFDYHFTWSFYHDDRYAGMGGRSYGSNGGITATHTLDKKLAFDWSVDLVGDDKNWWEQFCGGTKTIPDWVKNLSVQMPTFTLHLGSLYFFLTTNLLLPSQQVITVDTRTGIQIPGDLYLVGFVDDDDRW